ncbi:hypothetical protein B9Z65_2923 [Elsinoe australis]|uniref:Uncharacterized protein n=1 Tax=Elsinoe australis TaxID=40998 RepID=A0A2P7ZTY3_9PEZI|nr:hypothetical protein B9Z65_2923 [Elsinoe australis]
MDVKITVSELRLSTPEEAEQNLILSFSAEVWKSDTVHTSTFTKEFHRLFMHRFLLERPDIRIYRHGIRGTSHESADMEFVLWDGGELRVAVWKDNEAGDLFYGDGMVDVRGAFQGSRTDSIKMRTFHLENAKDMPWEKHTFSYPDQQQPTPLIPIKQNAGEHVAGVPAKNVPAVA